MSSSSSPCRGKFICGAMLRASRESKRLSLTLESAGDSRCSGMSIEMKACIGKDAHRAKASKSPKFWEAKSAHQVYRLMKAIMMESLRFLKVNGASDRDS